MALTLHYVVNAVEGIVLIRRGYNALARPGSSWFWLPTRGVMHVRQVVIAATLLLVACHSMGEPRRGKIIMVGKDAAIIVGCKVQVQRDAPAEAFDKTFEQWLQLRGNRSDNNPDRIEIWLGRNFFGWGFYENPALVKAHIARFLDERYKGGYHTPPSDWFLERPWFRSDSDC
jgi:hypothetical protein